MWVPYTNSSTISKGISFGQDAGQAASSARSGAQLPRWHDRAADGRVVPGLIGTPRPKDRPESAHPLTHGTITGERGRPDGVAAMVRFLCGPGARTITGQAIHAKGGAYLGT